MEPIRIGSVGLGNYAKHICNSLINASALKNPPVKLIAVCEPSNERYTEMAPTLTQANVPRFEKYEDLLNQDIEAVWLPLPIPLHRSFTEQALSAGKAVLVEKPVASTIQDVDALIAARDRAKRPVAVGFHSMAWPCINKIKRALLKGELGAIQMVSVRVAGARGESYYGRNNWAGKVALNGQWVLDSPANNAYAHGIHKAMYLAGATLEKSANPLSLEAELYRVNPIESYDTCSFRVQLEGNIPLLVYMTHGCEFFIDEVIEVQCEKGSAMIVRNVAVIRRPSGHEVIQLGHDERIDLIERFAHEVRGMPDERALPTLETARNQLLLVNGAMEATPIYDTPEDCKRKTKTPQGLSTALVGIEAMLTLNARLGCMFHESGLFPWTKPAGKIDLKNYRSFPSIPNNPILTPYAQAISQPVAAR